MKIFASVNLTALLNAELRLSKLSQKSSVICRA